MYSVCSVCLGLVLVNYITRCMYLHTLTLICSLPINLKVVTISIWASYCKFVWKGCWRGVVWTRQKHLPNAK